MTEQTTEYTFRTQFSGKLIEKTLNVPFSLEEIKKLEEARDIVQPWAANVLDGSSIYRDLYTNLRIPWADTLRNRSNALREVQATLYAIEKIVATSPKPDGYTQISDDLTSIQSSLLGFFELE